MLSAAAGKRSISASRSLPPPPFCLPGSCMSLCGMRSSRRRYRRTIIFTARSTATAAGGTLWITPVIGILCDALMLAVSFFPQTWNVGTSVTVFNRALVYRRVRDLIADMRLSTAVMFTAIAVWQTALAPTFPWGMGVLIGVCCTAPLVRFFVRLAMKK